MNLTSNNIWFTSDTHYNHPNLVRGTTRWRNSEGEIPLKDVRDFDTLEQMNELMIANINNSIGKNDWLIHLGDWSFGGIESVSEFRSLIKCDNIVLMLGNHYHHRQNDKTGLKKLFTHVAHYEELRVHQGKEKWNFVLCHYPIVSWNGMRKGAFMLHGHQHLKGDARFGEGRRMDVGLCGSEKTGFRPYHITEVINTLSIRTAINHH